MALTLPPNFSNDLIGNDTNLFPIVKIGNILIATSSEGLFKPLLLNIPSLKESIDLNTRKYKISSVSIDISNLPYDGQRFSELIDESSLINMNVDIYWGSQSTKILAIGDLDNDGLITNHEYFADDPEKLSDYELLIACNGPGTCFDLYGYQSDINNSGGGGVNISDVTMMSGGFLTEETDHLPAGYFGWTVGDGMPLYRGQIRRYTHDSDKVRLVLEDRSQGALHKDLPLPNTAGEPIRWLGTGAEVPDRYHNKPIPMVFGHVEKSPCVISNSPAVGEWGVELGHIDILAGDSNNEIKESYVYHGDKYAKIVSVLSDDDFIPVIGVSDSLLQNHLENDEVIIDETIVDKIRLLSRNTNLITQNKLPVVENSDINKVVIQPLREESNINWSLDISATNSQIFTSVYNSSTNEIMGSLVRDSHGGIDPINWDGVSLLNNLEGTSQDVFQELSGIIGTAEDVVFPGCNVQTNLSEGTFIESILMINLNAEAWYGNVITKTGTTNMRLIIHSFGANNDAQDSSGLTAFSETGEGWHQITMSGDDWSRLYTAGSTTPNFIIAMLPYTYGSGGAAHICAGKFKINNMLIRRYGLIDGIINQDFYANVEGRSYSGPTSENRSRLPYIIRDLFMYELGLYQESGTLYYQAATEYNELRYDFTINGKINSKKLIEDLTSASPFIARYDYLGNFTYNAIRTSYSSSNHTIYEKDVIDFSFSRTPIEDVVTKIDFRYNWDYARNDFSSRRLLDITNWACHVGGTWESFDYYGLPENHIESTLIIDDERGKYIRLDETAERFVCWLMSWYCNQHIVIKIKLPLSIGLKIEITDILNFDTLLGGIAPYGIDYVSTANQTPIFQTFYPYFMVTETNKRIDYVELSCIQMHKLYAEKADDVIDENMFYSNA